MSKIMVTFILFIVLSIIIPCPVHVTTFAASHTENGWLIDATSYEDTAFTPLIKPIINSGHWDEFTEINEENVSVWKIYEVNIPFLVVFIVGIILALYISSCFLEEYYRLKSLKPN
jgi:hypothetical protein